MSPEIDFWQLAGMAAGLLGALVSAMWALGNTLVRQYDRLLTERFASHQQLEIKGMESLKIRVDALEGTDREIGERLSRIEASVGKADIEHLHTRIDGVGKSLSHLEGQFKGANDLLRMIHGALMNGKGQ